MADTLTTLALLVLAQNYRGDLVNQINKVATLLKCIPITSGEGKNVAWAADSDATLVETYTDGADVVNYGGDAQDPAVLSWGLYRANPHMTKLAMDAARSSRTPVGNQMAWMNLIKKHAASLAKKINKDCFSGAANIIGLDTAIGSDTNTYAGIDRTVKAYWKPTVVDPGVGTVPTFAQMRDDRRAVLEASGSAPDLQICAPSVFNSIGNLFDQTRRQAEIVTSGRGPVTLNAGFHALEIDGVPIVADVDATKSGTTGSLYYLSTDHLHLEVLPDADQADMLAAHNLKAKIAPNDGFGEVPLGFTFEMLAKTGASEKAMMTSTLQLVVDRPNAFAVRKNIQF